jgi:hypothetical protein
MIYLRPYARQNTFWENWNKEWVKAIDEKKLKSIVEHLTFLQTALVD